MPGGLFLREKEARMPTERQVVETYQLAQAFDNSYIVNEAIER